MKIVDCSEIPISLESPKYSLLELYATGQKMERLCVDSKGLGLAAVQVGIPWKFFVYYNEKLKNFCYMLDCEYTPLSENKYVSIEGCLSIKGKNGEPRHFKVMRNESIRVDGKIIIAKDKMEIENYSETIQKGLECSIFQHEIDHHNNILISDIGEEIFIQYKIT